MHHDRHSAHRVISIATRSYELEPTALAHRRFNAGHSIDASPPQEQAADYPLRPGSVYGIQLMKLHTVTRLLSMCIEDAKLMGRPTSILEAELREKERQTNVLNAYLLAHARR